jgi:hypothetical protein
MGGEVSGPLHPRYTANTCAETSLLDVRFELADGRLLEAVVARVGGKVALGPGLVHVERDRRPGATLNTTISLCEYIHVHTGPSHSIDRFRKNDED